MNEVECPECKHEQDVTDSLPDTASEEGEHTCTNCDHVFDVGWYAMAEVR